MFLFIISVNSSHQIIVPVLKFFSYWVLLKSEGLVFSLLGRNFHSLIFIFVNGANDLSLYSIATFSQVTFSSLVLSLGFFIADFPPPFFLSYYHFLHYCPHSNIQEYRPELTNRFLYLWALLLLMMMLSTDLGVQNKWLF